MKQPDFVDYYEALQLSSKATTETIEKVYRILAKRYHPDNPDTGNRDKFAELHEAFSVLSDPEARAAYDVRHEALRGLQWKIFDQESASDSFDGDRRIFQGVLSLLYTKRRQDIEDAGLGILQLETMLGCPEEHLNFHVWYLKQKGWIERLQNGQLAITVDGIDRVVNGEMMLRKDRLLSASSQAKQSPGRRGEDSRGDENLLEDGDYAD